MKKILILILGIFSICAMSYACDCQQNNQDKDKKTTQESNQ